MNLRGCGVFLRGEYGGPCRGRTYDQEIKSRFALCVVSRETTYFTSKSVTNLASKSPSFWGPLRDSICCVCQDCGLTFRTSIMARYCPTCYGKRRRRRATDSTEVHS